MEEQEELEQALNSFFQELLEEPSVDRNEATNKIMEFIPSLVRYEKSDLLLRLVEM